MTTSGGLDADRAASSTASARLTRRLLLLGAGGLGVAAAGFLAARLKSAPPPITDDLAAASASDPTAGAPAQAPKPAPAAASPAASPSPGASGPPVPRGMALVASPRLPLHGIGPAQAAALLRGEVVDWRALGSAVGWRPEPLALPGLGPTGLRDARPVADYEALAAELAQRPGAFALAPVDTIDFRANALAIGLDDPLIDDDDIARVCVIGDIVPGRNVHKAMVRYGDFMHPFRAVAPLLKSFDLTIANLEGDLSSTLAQPADPHSFTFVSDPVMLDGFALAGIDAVTLANNHSVWNDEGWGVQGLLDTIAALTGRKMPYFGAGHDLTEARAPWIAKVGGRTIAWLGIDGVTANHEVDPGVANGVVDFDAAATADRAGTNPYASAQFLDDIAAAAKQADIVIPYFHMGAEYIGIVPPWAANGARAAIDAGATMVVTNHPHLVQGMEIYNGRPIVYSPGNFILDQMWGVEVSAGYALEIGFRGTQIVRLRCHGVQIQDFNQPRPMDAGEQANLMDRFWTSTDRLHARDG
ncbi:MAG TPA: CapA family protein [Thermomicrobiales bacterium]|nr:CapA family protein [Thermomicrobiales bacterium]